MQSAPTTAIEMANAEGPISIATTRTSKKKATLAEVGAAHAHAHALVARDFLYSCKKILFLRCNHA